MKAMIWKELRENARWALLAGLGLLMAELYALSMEKALVGNSFVAVSLCGENFLMVSAFGCAAVGAVLGALQILPELRRDQWASLLHRPIAREKILAGKMVAGLLLYAAATGIPLLASIVYLIWPGVYPAPFIPSMALPALSDGLLGLAFYVCALLVGLHPGRWLGTRGAIVLAAIGLLMAHLEDGWPFLLPIIAVIVFCVAAWGAMRNPVAQRPWFSRLAFGAAILAGVQAGVVLLGIALRAVPEEALFGFYYTNFYIAIDGAVFLQKQDGKGGFELTDMQGKAVTDERYVGNTADRYSLYPSLLADRTIAQGRRFLRNERSSQYRVEMIQGSYETPELWYRVEGQEPYFVGYDTLSRRPVGFLDREGFKSPDAVRQPFASVPQGEMLQMTPQLYWIGPQILSIDFLDRHVSPLIDVGTERIYGAQKVPNQSEHPLIAVALGAGIQIYDMKGAPLFRIPYAYPVDRWPNVGITATDDLSRIFVEYNNYAMSRDVVVHLDVLDGQGKRVASYPSPRERNVPAHKSWNQWTADLLKAPAPSVLLSIWNTHRQVSVEADYASGIPPALIPEFERMLEPGELAALGGWTLVLCAISVAWARKAGLSTARTLGWVGLTAIFGVGGLLAYRLSIDWPVRVRCPHCAHRRPVMEGACPNCLAPWDVPVANGTEIFEPA
ncbi:MAG TPA: hypothetical protein VGM54_21430 [Chthoniobacter sp.]|jgi:hypothetical protein